MITPERAKQMQDNFWAESADPATYEWRGSLTEEETEVVAHWDDLTNKGVCDMAAYTQKIIERSDNHE